MKLACINCGANVKYQIGTDNVYCEQCGSSVPISEMDKKIDWQKTLKIKEHTTPAFSFRIDREEVS